MTNRPPPRAPTGPATFVASTRPLGRLVRRCQGAGFAAFQSVQPHGLEVHGHAHANLSLCFLLSGSFHELGRRGASSHAGELVVSSPGEDVSLRFGPGPVSALVVDVAPELRRELARGREPRDVVSETLRGPVFQGLARRVHVELADAAAGGVAEPAVEEAVLALCQELSLPRARDGYESLSPAALTRALEALHEGFRGPVSLSTIAAQAGVHRMSLARTFRRRVGLSVGGYLHRLRTSYAMARLGEEPCRSLAEIAVEAGFADQSHLTRVFKRVTGRTPGGFRRAVSIVQDGDARSALSSGHEVDRDVPRRA